MGAADWNLHLLTRHHIWNIGSRHFMLVEYSQFSIIKRNVSGEFLEEEDYLLSGFCINESPKDSYQLKKRSEKIVIMGGK